MASSTDSDYHYISSKDSNRSIPYDLITASSLGDLVLVEKLMKAKLYDINGVNSSGWTALMYASHYGHFNVVRILIQNNCYVDYQDVKQGRTALMMAASNGHTRCMEMLINFGNADKNIRDNEGHDAVYYAKTCGHGNNKMIKAILGTAEVKARNMSSAEVRSDSPLKKKPALLKKMFEDPNAYDSSVFSNTSRPYWLPPKCFSAAEIVVPEESLTVVSTKMPPQLPNTYQDSTPSSAYYAHSSYTESYAPQPSVHAKDKWNSGRKPIIGRKNSRQKYNLPQQSSPPLPVSLNDLLSRIGLQQYHNLFETNGIDLYSFLILNEHDLRSIGITLLAHLKQLSIAQLRYHESVEIRSTQERLFADWLLNEREMYLRKILELEDRIKFFEYQEN